MPQKKVYLIDTNVILRYLVGDSPQNTAKASALMERVEKGEQIIEIPSVVVAECVWTLEKFYKVPRVVIAEKLDAIFQFKGIKGSEKKITIQALRTYAKINIDYVDCYLAASSVMNKRTVYSFDKKDFKRLEVDWEIP